MTLHEKIKEIRVDKKLSQSYLAHELGLDPAQYSRRESGEIDFKPKEIIILSKKLETPISKLFGEETNVFSINTQNGGNFGQYVTTSEKLIEQFELRLIEKEEMIAQLKMIVEKLSK